MNKRLAKAGIIFFLIVAVFYIPLGGLNVHTANAVDFLNWLGEAGNSISKLVAIGLIQVGGWLLWLAGLLFNESVKFSIINFSSKVTGASGFINEAWGVIRDLVNMSFIFILLWTAFKMILNLGPNVGKTIMNVIIVALLVNFSLAITKVIIDASNIVTLQFYNQITAVPTGTSPTNIPGTNINDKGLSDIFMQSLKLGTLFDNKGIDNKDLTNLGVKLLLVGVAGFALTVGAAVIFFMITIAFIIRIAVLIFLMVTSPVMFLNWILPQAPSAKWWKSLSDQVLFAPVFMLFMWITVKMMQSNAFKNLAGDASFSEAFGTSKAANNPELAALFISFGIILIFLVMSLRVAKQFGAIGTDWAGKAFGAVAFGGAAFAARSTIGRAATRLADNDGFKNLAGKYAAAEYALKATRGVASSSLDLRAATPIKAAAGVAGIGLGKTQQGGYGETFKTQVGARTGFAKSLGMRKETDAQGRETYVDRATDYGKRIENRGIISFVTATTKANRTAAKEIKKRDPDEIKKMRQEISDRRRDIELLKRETRTATDKWEVAMPNGTNPDPAEEARQKQIIKDSQEKIDILQSEIDQIKKRYESQ